MENIFGIACLYYLTNEDETDVEPHLITGLFTHPAAKRCKETMKGNRERHQIPFIGAHRIHEPVILREPHIITTSRDDNKHVTVNRL